MNLTLISQAFEEGVKSALKFFQGAGGRKALSEHAEAVIKNMDKAAKAAKRVGK